MADFVVVGGTPIKVSPSSGKADWNDAVDRRRSFNNNYFASATGGAAREWHFSTPPITRAVAGTYRAVLSQVQAQMCSGEGLELPTMCCAELIGETPVKGAASNYVSLDFALHESQSKRLLLKYAPGDTITGESFTRSTVAYQLSGNIADPLAVVGINAKRDTHYINSVRSILLEDARTNVVLQSRLLSTAAWTKTNITATGTSTGADGAVTSATRLTATAGNGTVLQAITLASSARFQTAWVKRITGAGLIQMTMDNGATWTTVPISTVYTRVSIPTQTLANPTVGFRLVNNGDAIDVDFVQNENGTFASSEIVTGAVAVTRGADSYSLPFTTPPQEMTVYAKFVEGGSVLVAGARVFEFASSGGADPRFLVQSNPTVYSFYHNNGVGIRNTPIIAAGPSIGNTVELNTRLFGDGSVDLTQSINSAAETTSGQSASLSLAAAWSAQLAWLNSEGTAGGYGFTALQQFKIVAGSRSLAEMRAA